MIEDYKRFVAAKLMKSNFSDIKILPSSEDFGAHILATSKSGKKICVRCCWYDDIVPVRVYEVETAAHARKYYGCNAAMLVTNVMFTEKAQSKARSLGVILKDSVAMPKPQISDTKKAQIEEQERKNAEKTKESWQIFGTVLLILALIVYLSMTLDWNVVWEVRLLPA